MALEIVDDNTFKNKVATGLVLVDFYANWCGPCRMLTPVLEKLQESLGTAVSIVKVDTDSSEKVAAEMRITSIPTMILFKEGKEVERVVGLRDEAALKSMIQKHQ
jgi:thioredoxin 1